MHVLPTIMKQYKNPVHSSTNINPIQPSLKKIEAFVNDNLSENRKKIKPIFQVNDLVRAADLKITFPKSDTTSWSYKLYKNTEFIKDTKPIYRIDILPQRYNEALLKKPNLTMKENNDVMKKLNLN